MQQVEEINCISRGEHCVRLHCSLGSFFLPELIVQLLLHYILIAHEAAESSCVCRICVADEDLKSILILFNSNKAFIDGQLKMYSQMCLLYLRYC